MASEISQQPTLHTHAPNEHSDASSQDTEAKRAIALRGRNIHDAMLLSAIFIMLVWPWIFFGVIWYLGGVQMNDNLANRVWNHPRTASFFLTLFGDAVSLTINILFSIAIIRLAQEWVTVNDHVTLFHVSLFAALKNQEFPWSPLTNSEDRKYLLTLRRSLLAFLVLACITTFAFVSPGATSLVYPTQYSKNASLTGSELDFSSNTPECTDWFNANTLQDSCEWRAYKDIQYMSCLGENQMVDALESGRGNILNLQSNNTEALSFSQLGANGNLQFLGSIRGVLPIGPNGINAFNTISGFPKIPTSDPQSGASLFPYEYELGLQGLRNEVKCAYDTDSPIRFAPVSPDTNNLVLQYDGTCPQGADVLPVERPYISVNSNNTLGFWACKDITSESQERGHIIYLRGWNHYEDVIGNMTCTLSPIQFATLPVTYWSELGAFFSTNWSDVSANISSDPIQRAVIGAVGMIINQAQNWQANLVAESVVSTGVRTFGLPPDAQNETYPLLYEAMIQGIIEYEASYVRLLYSTDPSPPSSCVRPISGLATYWVLGWSVGFENIGFLMPMTIINLASIIIVLITVFRRKGIFCDFDPTDSMPLVLASSDGQDAQVQGWKTKVKYDLGKHVKEKIMNMEISDAAGNNDNMQAKSES